MIILCYRANSNSFTINIFYGTHVSISFVLTAVYNYFTSCTAEVSIYLLPDVIIKNIEHESLKTLSVSNVNVLFYK